MLELLYKYKSKILITLIVLSLGLSIAYAVLNESLVVSFTQVSIPAGSWKINFKNETVTGTATGDAICNSVTVTEKSITVSDITVTKPGDKCSYAITIQNSGTIDAKIGSIVPTKPKDENNTEVSCSTASGSTIICGNITYRLRKTSATSTSYLATGDVYNKNTNTIVYLTAEYSGSSLEPDDFFQNSFKYTINFVQK